MPRNCKLKSMLVSACDEGEWRLTHAEPSYFCRLPAVHILRRTALSASTCCPVYKLSWVSLALLTPHSLWAGHRVSAPHERASRCRTLVLDPDFVRLA